MGPATLVSVLSRCKEIARQALDFLCNSDMNNAFQRVLNVQRSYTNTDNEKHGHTLPCKLLRDRPSDIGRKSTHRRVLCKIQSLPTVLILFAVLYSASLVVAVVNDDREFAVDSAIESAW